MEYYLKTTGILLGSWIILLIITIILMWVWCWINDIEESKPNPILRLIAGLLGFPKWDSESGFYHTIKARPEDLLVSRSGDSGPEVISVFNLITGSIAFMCSASFIFISWQLTLVIVSLILLAFILRFMIRRKNKGH